MKYQKNPLVIKTLPTIVILSLFSACVFATMVYLLNYTDLFLEVKWLIASLVTGAVFYLVGLKVGLTALGQLQIVLFPLVSVILYTYHFEVLENSITVVSWMSIIMAISVALSTIVVIARFVHGTDYLDRIEKKTKKSHLRFFLSYLVNTLLGYAFCLMIYPLFGLHAISFNLSSVIAIIIIAFGLVIEVVSVVQSFSSESFSRHGLWKAIRHPDDLGNWVGWFGRYLLMVSVFPSTAGRGEWILIVFPIGYLLYLVFMVFPPREKAICSMDKEYIAYISQTSSLLPFKPIPKSNNENNRK